jgi:hypothetical protein
MGVLALALALGGVEVALAAGCGEATSCDACTASPFCGWCQPGPIVYKNGVRTGCFVLLSILTAGGQGREGRTGRSKGEAAAWCHATWCLPSSAGQMGMV